MSAVAYLRNGVKAGPIPTYFDISPQVGFTSTKGAPSITPQIPKKPPKYNVMPLIPSAVHQPYSRSVLGVKPTPFSRFTGIDPGPKSSGLIPQGYGRHQKQGLAYKVDKYDRTQGKLLIQSDSSFAGLNNRIPVPN